MRRAIMAITSAIISAMLLSSCTGSGRIDTEGMVTTSEGSFTWDDATVYFAITDRFLNGDESNDSSYGRQKVDEKGKTIATFNGGDIKGLTEKLEEGYFRDLGVDAIWITAPYEQIHGYVKGTNDEFQHYPFHGYYALDWTMMDKNMGTVEEFRTFVDTTHSQGIRIVMDVVMNHVGYSTEADMEEFGFGDGAWDRWWGSSWVRSDKEGYENGGSDDITMTLAGLPDVKTEETEATGLPPVLLTKWDKESDGYDEWILPEAKKLRTDLGLSPAGYITEWLTAWIREFGIDGFRIDTAKHVELERWTELSKKADEALEDWRAKNSGKPGSEWDDSFWMNGEVWGHGVVRDRYFDGGFDSVINFTFQGEKKNGPAYDMDTMDSVFGKYADALNEDTSFNVLSYISQHDTFLYDRKRLVEGSTYLMLLPGAVMIFYGDETARPMGDGGSDYTQGTRSGMNWDSIDQEILKHYRKIASFRHRNIAVGAGDHTMLKEKPYTFSRTYAKDGLDNRVIVVIGAEGKTIIDVSSVFADGDTVRDAYSMEAAVVKKGKVTFTADDKGIILIEKLVKK